MSIKQPLMNQSLQKNSIAEQIIYQITQAIISGELKPGDKLPTETSLCTTFGVSRNSVREAIKILEAYGVVYIKRADGTFISDSYNQKMLDPMLYGILLQKDFGEEIVELRKVLDIGIMHLIMHKLSDTALTHMEECLTALESAITAPSPDIEQILKADIEFHMAITKAADNELMLSMYGYVDRITAPSRAGAIQIVLKSGAADNFIELHKQLIEMIKYKNVDQIEQTLTEHYIFWKQVV